MLKSHVEKFELKSTNKNNQAKAKTKKHPPTTKALSKVGMEKIELFGCLESPQGTFQIPLKASALVSLDHLEARGIHMSRLYRLLTEKISHTPLQKIKWGALAKEMVESQSGLSKTAELKISGQWPMWRRSLVSNEKGQRTYPFSAICFYDAETNKVNFEVKFEVLYSSTCPCSAALAMEEWQEHPESFKEGEWVATPHAQRSRATIRLKMASNQSLQLLPEWIEQIEKALGTPVQTLVKRVDELEFAKRNAENLMFAEDAVRKLVYELETWPVDHFSVKVEHFESLHAHNAVAYAEK